MDPSATPQPLDALMNRLGLTNADLVKASTEQLTFKMVHKGRTGRRLTPNVQAKIHNALLAAKPGLQVRRRDLFHYEPAESFVEGIAGANARARAREVTYPQLVDLFEAAGVTGYKVEVAAHRITYFGGGGEAHTIQGPAVSAPGPGSYNEDAVLAAIKDAQDGRIDYLGFLARIYGAGIVSYDVNVRSRKIVYQGREFSHGEDIPSSDAAAAPAAPAAAKARPKKKKSPNRRRSLTRKARMSSNKRWRKRQKEKRRRFSR